MEATTCQNEEDIYVFRMLRGRKMSKRLLKLKIRFLKATIRRNRKTMSMLAAEKKKIETEIDLVIMKNRQLESELAEWEKEL
jgi:hypothetical protein